MRVRGSFPQGDSGWRFVLESSGAATAHLAIRCLDETTGETNGHVHLLALVEHDKTFSVPPHQTVTDRVECGSDGKGIVGSYDLDPGLISLGNEPQPVNRDFRIENPTDAPLDARLDLLCLGDRTTGAPTIDRFVNTASVSSPTPDPDTDDRSATATVTRVPVGAGPAGLQGSTLKLPISCDKRCKGKATVRTVGKVHAAGTTLRRHQVLGKGGFKLRAHHRKSLRIGVGRRAAKALRRAHVRTVLVNLRVAGRGSHSVRVQLRTK